MVAHAGTDSLEKFLLYIHKDYVCISQNFYVFGTNGHHFVFHATPCLLFPLRH